MATQNILIVLSLVFRFVLLNAAPEKVQIDPATQLYIGKDDGRVRMLHGLALEDSSPPWGLAVYSDSQIQLMQKVILARSHVLKYLCIVRVRTYFYYVSIYMVSAEL